MTPAPRLRALLLTLVFAPDSVSTANLLTELTQQVQRLGVDWVVVTTTPHYNQDPEKLKSQPLRREWGRWLWRSECAEIPVYHVRVQAKGRRILTRLLDYLGFHVLGTLAGLWRAGRYDVVLAPSPPLTIGLSALVLARLRNVPYLYNVQEIYPDIAVSLGVIRNPMLIWALERLEAFIYSQAEQVVVISEKFRQRLLAKGVPAGKLRVIPNFVDVNFIRPGPRSNAFSQQHGLDGQFVISYSGNLGLTQDFETVLTAARALQDLPVVRFVIIGDGGRRDWLAGEIDRTGLANVQLLPYQPASLVPLVYASSDLCLVPLRAATALDTFPSKIYTIMAAGRPALVAADPDSELAWVVEQAQSGLTVPPGDPAALAQTIRRAVEQSETLAEMGRHGREYVVAHHSAEAVAHQYAALLSEVARPAAPRAAP